MVCVLLGPEPLRSVQVGGQGCSGLPYVKDLAPFYPLLLQPPVWNTGSSHHTHLSSQQKGRKETKRGAALCKDTASKLHMVLHFPGLGAEVRPVGTPS